VAALAIICVDAFDGVLSVKPAPFVKEKGSGEYLIVR
jgi:hypothetical protein